MSKTDVLADLNSLTVSQAESLCDEEGPNGDRIAIKKDSSGPGYSGNLEDIIIDFYGLSAEDREWVYDQFNSTSNLAFRPLLG